MSLQVKHPFLFNWICKPRRSKKCRRFFIVMFYCHNFQFRTIFRIIFPIRGFGLGHWESSLQYLWHSFFIIFPNLSEHLHPIICSQPFSRHSQRLCVPMAPQPRLGHGLRIGASKKTMAAAFAQQTLVPHGHRLLELAVGIDGGFGVRWCSLLYVTCGTIAFWL